MPYVLNIWPQKIKTHHYWHPLVYFIFKLIQFINYLILCVETWILTQPIIILNNYFFFIKNRNNHNYIKINKKKPYKIYNKMQKYFLYIYSSIIIAILLAITQNHNNKLHLFPLQTKQFVWLFNFIINTGKKNIFIYVTYWEVFIYKHKV